MELYGGGRRRGSLAGCISKVLVRFDSQSNGYESLKV